MAFHFYSGNIPGDCIYRGRLYLPQDIAPNQEDPVVNTVYDCQRRCANTKSCSYFSYWDDGRCSLSTSSANIEDCSDGDHCGKVSGGPAVCPGGCSVWPPSIMYETSSFPSTYDGSLSFKFFYSFSPSVSGCGIGT